MRQQLLRPLRLVIDLESGEVEDLGAGSMPNWSPDGNWISFCKYREERGVFVCSRDGKTVRQIDLDGWGIQWSPDGWEVAYALDHRFVVHNFVSALSWEIVPAEWDYTSESGSCRSLRPDLRVCSRHR